MRQGGRVGPAARPAHPRRGGGRRDLGVHGPPGPARRAAQARPTGPGHRRVRRRRDLRRTTGQGARGRTCHRGVQRPQGGPGPLPRRRRDRGLHPRGPHRCGPPPRPRPRHRRQPTPPPAAPNPDPARDPGHRRRRDGRPLARRPRPAAACPAPVTLHPPALARTRRDPRPEDLRTLGELIESGALTPVVDRTYPLARVPDALRHLRAGRVRGKIAIRVGAGGP